MSHPRHPPDALYATIGKIALWFIGTLLISVAVGIIGHAAGVPDGLGIATTCAFTAGVNLIAGAWNSK